MNAPISVENADHLRYHWDGDWVVPSIRNIVSVDQPDRNPLTRYVIWANVAILALLWAGIMVYRQRKHKHNS